MLLLLPLCPTYGTVVPYASLKTAGIVPIGSHEVPPLKQKRSSGILGVAMKIMHLCYAALGFAVARWIFRRQATAVVDPVTRFRSQGLL